MVCKKIEKGQGKGERRAISEYGLRRKVFTLVMEELKQRITAKATKVKRYDNRINYFKATGMSRPTKEYFSNTLKIKRRG